MKYYIIKNRKMPWGDYGNTLFEGLLSVMDENYQITEVHKIERTAPYIPEIYTTISNYIVVREDIAEVKYDLFQCGSIIASEKFKNLIETHTNNCLRFIPLQESK